MDTHEHRKPTWLELLFDLLFTVTLAKLGKDFMETALHKGITLAVQDYIFIFFPAYGTWLPISRFLNQYDTEDTLSTFFQLFNMVTKIQFFFVSSTVVADIHDGAQFVDRKLFI